MSSKAAVMLLSVPFDGSNDHDSPLMTAIKASMKDCPPMM